MCTGPEGHKSSHALKITGPKSLGSIVNNVILLHHRSTAVDQSVMKLGR
jgi:hypothetical protein